MIESDPPRSSLASPAAPAAPSTPQGPPTRVQQPPVGTELERFPALGLRIASPPSGAAPEVDFRRDFHAAGDGAVDDMPAFKALADAVNAGRVPAGAVVAIPPGVYRVVGNDTVTFRRPVVLRGAGPAESVIQIEYTAQRSVFLRATGAGMYAAHSTGLYSGRQEQNRYPSAPFSSVTGVPKRGDVAVAVERPDLFSPGDNVFLLCDDYGPEVVYRANNKRLQHFLLKQYAAVTKVDGAQVWLDVPLRHDFAGAAPRLYKWQPLSGFGVEHLAIDDRNDIADTEETNTFKGVHLDGVVDGWVWNVHFRDNTSHPLTVGRSRRVVVSECVFDRARHVGGGGNGYLPEIYYSDDSLIEYNTSIAGRHALICNWSCWGNVFRYNRLQGTPNTETHGEYSVENVYLRNDCRGARMEVGGGGDTTHAHDGPYNELRENYAQVLRVLKRADRDNRLAGNWLVSPIVNPAPGTIAEGNQQGPAGWDGFPYAAFGGHVHAQTAETARPGGGQ
jgi:hypothetical protein